MAEGAGGALFVVGTYLDPSRNKHWFLRRSDNNGVNWANTGWDISDLKTDPSPYIATDSNGSIYVGGSHNRAWTAFKSTDTQGTSFATVDNIAIAGERFNPGALIVNANNEVFAIGDGVCCPSSVTVRKSDSMGMNWSTIFQYSYATGYSTLAFDGTTDSSGGLFIGAGTSDSAGEFGLAVLRSNSNGSSWNIIEDFQPVAPLKIKDGVVLRALGKRLYLTGITSDDTTNLGELFMRECDIETTCTVGTWTVSDLQSIESNGNDDGIFGIGQDQFGTLWLNGYSFDFSGALYPIIFKKTTTGAWSEAHLEVGGFRVGGYLRTSTNRFFLSGVELNSGGLEAIVMEYQ